MTMMCAGKTRILRLVPPRGRLLTNLRETEYRDSSILIGDFNGDVLRQSPREYGYFDAHVTVWIKS